MSPACPVCAATRTGPVFQRPRVPAHSVRTFATRPAALAAPAGVLDIQGCGNCGLLWNCGFAPQLMQYDQDYESTQAGSPAFDEFHRTLAERLVGQHGLVGKAILEIGCGQGEFLRLLLQAGAGSCTGFDPAYRGGNSDGAIVVQPRVFEGNEPVTADLVVCKMTLEHLTDPIAFLAAIRRSLGDRASAPLVLTVPNTAYIVADRAFWDLYHEHAFYFGPRALREALGQVGFVVADLEAVWGNQYLLVTARAGEARPDGPSGGGGADPAALGQELEQSVTRWRRLVLGVAAGGGRVALWGGGSKAVAFLTALGVGPEVRAVVDINPRRQGTFLPGTGHEILSPESLAARRPTRVIAMNPVYREEIAAELERLGLDTALMALGDDL